MINAQPVLLSIFVGFGAAVLLLSRLIPIAANIGLVDHPGIRKDHLHPTPLVGGLAMYIENTGHELEFRYSSARVEVIAATPRAAKFVSDFFGRLHPRRRCSNEELSGSSDPPSRAAEATADRSSRSSGGDNNATDDSSETSSSSS